MIAEEWTGRRSQLADRLRELRLHAGLSGKQLSELAGWQPSKVSRAENGHQLLSAADVTRWSELCGADDARRQELVDLREAASSAHRDWHRQVRLGQQQVQVDYNRLVELSSVIRHFETTWVPGLLQTPAYAAWVFTGSARLHQVPVDDVQLAVTARLQRQRHLYDPGKRFDFLIAEPVLRWRFCPPEVMRAQLDRLRSVVGLPTVRLGVLPMDTMITTPPQNAFQLYDDTAMVETFVGETTHGPSESARYAAVLTELWRDAVTDDGALTLINSAAARLA